MAQQSCTTKDDDYSFIYRFLIIPGGAGFQPSTVCSYFLSFFVVTYLLHIL